tara:strand:+ start:409 stop:1422 length:1014 start_codon:yes stop_codon:yes gene_type:complete
MFCLEGYVQEKQPYFAAIDLGSNSCRLLVVTPENGKLITVEAFSRIVRLSEGLTATDLMSDQAMSRVYDVLEQSAKRLRLYSPVILECVATEACRKAKNSLPFLKRIKEKLGLDFRVITEEEEARLTVRGITSLLDPSFPYGIVFDVGGGSTEIVLLKQQDKGLPEIIDWLSMPVGVVSIAEIEQPDHATSYLRVVSMIADALEKFSAPHNLLDLLKHNKVQLIGSSGTATTAAALHLGLHYYDKHRIDGQILTFPDFEKVIKEIQMMSYEERAQHPCIGPDRADLVLGGMAIFEGLAKAWPIGKLTVADRGVRDGLVDKLYENYLEKSDLGLRGES